MADFRDVLKAHGISEEVYLSIVGSPEAREWRSGEDMLNALDFTPSNYVKGAFDWGTTRRRVGFPWSYLHYTWIDRIGKERWPELEVALGWIDPLELELREVKDG